MNNPFEITTKFVDAWKEKAPKDIRGGDVNYPYISGVLESRVGLMLAKVKSKDPELYQELVEDMEV